VKLDNFHRSSASSRVRIALALKGLSAETVTINLRRGEQRGEAFLARAPSGLVPNLQNGSTALGQSLAIIQYLDDLYPQPRVFPSEPVARARAWEFALTIACDIHPLNNLRVLQFLEREIGADDAQRAKWYTHWVTAGFETFEALLAHHAGRGPFCLGAELSIADICLVPQVTNARRFDVSLGRFPRIVTIDAHCRSLRAFIAADVPTADDPAPSEAPR